MYITFIPSFYSKSRDIRNIQYIKLYCFHGHMHTNTCLVLAPARSLCLWSKCSGYMLPKQDISWGIFWTRAVDTRKVYSLLRISCSCKEGMNFSASMSWTFKRLSSWAWSILGVTRSTTPIRVKRCRDKVLCCEVL